MRLWSFHPRYLDRQGLLALWREALLARAVLQGRTRGYRHHPQLDRFRAHASPRSSINCYLAVVHDEAALRGYSFDRRKIGPARSIDSIPVMSGQLAYEWQRLLGKLAVRTPELHHRWASLAAPDCHPLFRVRPGPIEPWERGGGVSSGAE